MGFMQSHSLAPVFEEWNCRLRLVAWRPLQCGVALAQGEEKPLAVPASRADGGQDSGSC